MYKEFMGKITLITGGVRSGKSAYALLCTSAVSGMKEFIATAIPFDSEMEERARNHQLERGDAFVTIEEPYDLPKAISGLHGDIQAVVVDCLTVWLGNLFYKHENELDFIKLNIDQLIGSFNDCHADIYMVTNEVGWGIVPDNKLSRLFRDYNGLMNQKIASRADEVVVVTCGIPSKIKG
jgi:adenosylcobinamide kinase / adenosylcobinamide-phosphate guanylyltransferase